jgi:hypothetical protein
VTFSANQKKIRRNQKSENYSFILDRGLDRGVGGVALT